MHWRIAFHHTMCFLDKDETNFLDGAATGARGEMSKTGWSCSSVFQNYLTKYFV